MESITVASSSHLIPHLGNPLNPQPIPPLASEPATTTTIESIVSTPLDPGVTTPTKTVQYEKSPTQEVIVTSTKVVEQTPKKIHTSGEETYKMQMIDDDDHHPEKSKSCCSKLNKLFLALAMICLTLLLCSLGYIISNLEGFNSKSIGHKINRLNAHYSYGDDFYSSEQLITEPYFNLTHPTNEGFIVVLSRRGASVVDILIPSKDANNGKSSRSIVVKGGNQNHYGAVRFGFEDPKNSMNTIYQLPKTDQLSNLHQEDWTMYADSNKPYRVRFVHGLIQIIYEFSSKHSNELAMTTMVAALSNQKIIVDPTNNIYFNLRGHGDLSTHYLNISSSDPIDISTGQKVEQDRLIQSQRLDQSNNINKYFYKYQRAGIGKNHIATLVESDTKTKLNIFADHTGVVLDPFGVGTATKDDQPVTATPDVRGIRISPRQSPTNEAISLYGPIVVEYPSQAIHTTWWQFD